MPAYLTRGEAVAAYGAGDPIVDETNVFQGDLFVGLDLFAPGKEGDPWVVSHGIVISHHCQWTKARKALDRGADWPILVAPAHELHSSLKQNEQDLVREGKFRYYLYLPSEGLAPDFAQTHSQTIPLVLHEVRDSAVDLGHPTTVLQVASDC